MIGVSGLLVRMGMKEIEMGPAFLLSFASEPWSWLALAFGAAGFIYLQKALFSERVAYVVPTVSALSIVTPVVISSVILGEYVSLLRWIGLWLILVGVIGISKGEWDEGLIASLLKSVRRRE
jgi:uncharacterized membrane protein